MRASSAPATAAQFPPGGPPIVPDSGDIVVYACPTKAGGQLRFNCACGRIHLHGRIPPGDDVTPYKVSHCREPGSPLFEKHYLLVEVPENDPRLLPAPRGRPKRQ